MGLLVAGVTGGASMIENAKITSLKREVDDHIRDVFTFYSRTGRFPGELDNNGRFGYYYGQSKKYPINSFSEPYYDIADISEVSGPFIELYLYGISSFKPNPSGDAIKTSFTYETYPTVVNGGGIPISKIYKYYVFVHRTDDSPYSDPNHTFYDLKVPTFSINMFTITMTKKTLDIARKIDTKFDDGSHSGGNIRGWCNKNHTVRYDGVGTNYCTEVLFLF
jgi:hypothetical protein